jgi:hypothetical protein
LGIVWHETCSLYHVLRDQLSLDHVLLRDKVSCILPKAACTAAGASFKAPEFDSDTLDSYAEIRGALGIAAIIQASTKTTRPLSIKTTVECFSARIQ